MIIAFDLFRSLATISKFSHPTASGLLETSFFSHNDNTKSITLDRVSAVQGYAHDCFTDDGVACAHVTSVGVAVHRWGIRLDYWLRSAPTPVPDRCRLEDGPTAFNMAYATRYGERYEDS